MLKSCFLNPLMMFYGNKEDCDDVDFQNETIPWYKIVPDMASTAFLTGCNNFI